MPYLSWQRYPVYTSRERERLQAEILRRMRGGEAVTRICADPAMPSAGAVYKWARGDYDFGEAFAAARAQAEGDRLFRARHRELHTWRIEGDRVIHRRKGGRKSTYTPRIGRRVCEAICHGASLKEACARSGMPPLMTVYGWLRRHPEFRARYDDACAVRQMVLEDQVDQAIVRFSPIDMRLARRRVKALDHRARQLGSKNRGMRGLLFKTPR